MVVDYSQPPKMVPFNGANCLDWVLQVERYFFCNLVPESLKLTLASLFIEGSARELFCPLYRNNKFLDWDHFVDELFICFRHLDNRHNSICTCSQQFAARLDVVTVSEDVHEAGEVATCEVGSNLANENSNPVDNSEGKIEEVTKMKIDADLLKEHVNSIDTPKVLTTLLANPIGTSSDSTPFTPLVVSLSCIGSSDTPLELGYNMEIFSNNSICTVFDEIIDREIVTEVENSITTNSESNHELREMVNKITDDEHHSTVLGSTDDSVKTIYPLHIIDFPFDPGLLKLNHTVDAYKRVPTNSHGNMKHCACLLTSNRKLDRVTPYAAIGTTNMVSDDSLFFLDMGTISSMLAGNTLFQSFMAFNVGGDGTGAGFEWPLLAYVSVPYGQHSKLEAPDYGTLMCHHSSNRPDLSIGYEEWNNVMQGNFFELDTLNDVRIKKEVLELSRGILLDILQPRSSGVAIYNLYPYDPGPHVLLPTTYGFVCWTGIAVNILSSSLSSGDGCTYMLLCHSPDPKFYANMLWLFLMHLKVVVGLM